MYSVESTPPHLSISHLPPLTPQLPAYHAEEIFDTIDTNHDGKIDLKEFTVYVTAKELLLRETFDKVRVEHKTHSQIHPPQLM